LGQTTYIYIHTHTQKGWSSKSALNNPWTLSRVECFMEIATPYCRMFEHAKFCCKICSANSHRRTEGMALLCDNKHAAGSRVRL